MNISESPLFSAYSIDWVFGLVQFPSLQDATQQAYSWKISILHCQPICVVNITFQDIYIYLEHLKHCQYNQFQLYFIRQI